VLEEIGHGGMATVYRARDRRLGREVAVKIIHRHLRENREVAQRFESEARAVAKLKHPNIVEVYDVSDAHEDERFLVVELVRGSTLRRLLAENVFLPPEIAAALGIEIAEALEHAHQLGVIHRDVKPENVLVADPHINAAPPDRDPVDVKITDFGIAKLLDAQGVTSTGQVLGSPAHMAPEQIEGGDVTARADVFGLGVMLYETMVGRLPFDGKNPAQVLRRVLDGQFTPADRARATIGTSYSEALSRALAHDANDRYASAAEFAAALRSELTALGIVEPRRELHAFLLDPIAYSAQHEAMLITRLTERGRQAGAQGNVQLAAACYNRALAYRPDDRELIASVTRLVRRERLRKGARRGAIVLASVAVGVTALAGATRLVPRPKADAREPPEPVRSTLSPTVALPSARPTATAPPSAAPSASVRRLRVGERPLPRPSAEPDSRPDEGTEAKLEPVLEGAGPGRVRILVDGPQSAIVRIDGTETAWFGKIQELSSGTHSFEFVPPDDRCCKGSQLLSVNVPVSSGPGDIHTVRGRIEFRAATFDLRGPAGSTASCGPLGVFPVPSQQQIPMSTPLMRVSCQLLPAPGSAEPPKEFDVTLKPGRLSTNLGQ
jgi:tRNA A-37 threonylcarbamoyl transferase component Bud32